MPEVIAVSVPADVEGENEDAFALGDGVAVVVDGAGLPQEMRAGCQHSVHWYADALAGAFRNHLDRRNSEMPQALASAIAAVAESHADACRLAEGSPSATVAAWRLHPETVEYLVLCDASIILGFRDGSATEVTDDRITRATTPLVEEQLRGIRVHGGFVTAADARRARRVAVEQTRNRDGGFWCCQTDPGAAFAAIHGEVERGALSAVVAASDGATRGHQLLGTQSPRDLVAAVRTGRSAGVIASIRRAERESHALSEQGFKQHDDATLVAAILDR